MTSATTPAAAAAPAPTTVPAIGAPWPAQGGIYAGITRDAQSGNHFHLIVSTDPAGSFDATWGGAGTEVAGASDRWDGVANTRALLAATTDHPAAQRCAALTIDGHADWYLPAQRELTVCLVNVPELFETDDWYWSSTQYSRHYAWFQFFGYGFQDYGDKGYEAHVRAVRRFPLQS